ncbi:Acyl-CoA-binding domain-containing protein 5 [Pseudolycoriella hygida]|uniref:Acyl-CoA-binding domain-containing protein 5 n=1 Tax=Pseudolycoriella hygida TaxID=35572 RepID=A0A9Q0RXT3_9DIPT|nr:Acyl-CoA-binding domain-containing protein 5 [Pseudolycoriella hygida]
MKLYWNATTTMEKTEERFKAAVNVIRGLPKSGSYQPSNDMMLRFYSYFKQATLGPCTQKKPAFWDIVGRAKYEAYKSLGNMSKERAMDLYVDELKKIIETMTYNGDALMGNASELNGIDISDLEAVAPDAMKKVCSHPNSPFASREASPIRASHRNGHDANETLVNGYNHLVEKFQSGHSTEHSDDEYIDTVEDDADLHREPILSTHISRPTTRRALQYTPTHSQQIEPAINQILRTVELMSKDLQEVSRRIDDVERSMVTRDSFKTLDRYPRWWPFTNISPSWFIFMLLWPFLAQRLGKMLRKKSQ